MKSISNLLIYFIVIGMVVLMSACAPALEGKSEPEGTVQDNNQNEMEQPSESIENEAVDIADEALEFVDATGRQVKIAGLPQRIVVAGKATPYVLDTIYMFPGAGKKLAALEVRGFDTQEFLQLVDPDVQVKNMLDRDAGPEQIAPYRPDLVIVKNISLVQLGSALEEISIPVMGLNLETPEFFYEDIRVLGKVFGDENRAEYIVGYYQIIEQRIADLMTDLKDDDRPSVLVIQYSEDGGEISFKVPPASYLQTIMVKKAGGNPIWLEADGGTNSWIQVGLEQIAVWNPEMIFVVNYNGDSVESAQLLAASSTWEGLQAVEKEQIYGFPADYASWDLIDPRWILGQQWLATIIQPERAADIDLQAQVMSFYQEIYGLSDSQITESIIPRLEEVK